MNGHDEQRDKHHDEKSGAHDFVPPAEFPSFDNALAEGFLVSRVTVRAAGRALGGTKLGGPDRRQEEKNRLDEIRAAGAELGDEHAGEGGAGAARGVKDNGVETDGVGQIAGRHSIGDQGSPCRLQKDLDNRHQDRGDIDVPRPDLTGKNQQRRHCSTITRWRFG